MKQSNSARKFSFVWQWCAPALFGLMVPIASLAGTSSLIAPSPSVTSAEQELLEPERAFLLSARFKDAKTAELIYKIADGYYMYRARFNVVADPKLSAKLGKPVFAKGVMKQDDTFGRVEIFRNSMRILIPIASLSKGTNAGSDKTLRLKVTSQGCADAGVCFPPFHQTLALTSGAGDISYPDAPPGVDSAVAPQFSSESARPSLGEILRKSR